MNERELVIENPHEIVPPAPFTHSEMLVFIEKTRQQVIADYAAIGIEVPK